MAAQLTGGGASPPLFFALLHYLLSELSLKEAKAIIQQAMGEEATDEAIAQIYSLTGGVHRHVDMIIPRIFHLMELNRKALLRREGQDESVDRVGRSATDGRVKTLWEPLAHSQYGRLS